MTQKIGVTEKSEKKEARGNQGDVAAVAYYGNSSEISIEGIGDVNGTTAALVATLTVPAGVTRSLAGILICEEVTRDYSNEDFVKSSIKGSAYPLITS